MPTIHNVRFDKDFTVTYNRTPEMPGVSWGAKGLLWYILSRSKKVKKEASKKSFRDCLPTQEHKDLFEEN